MTSLSGKNFKFSAFYNRSQEIAPSRLSTPDSVFRDKKRLGRTLSGSREFFKIPGKIELKLQKHLIQEIPFLIRRVTTELLLKQSYSYY